MKKLVVRISVALVLAGIILCAVCACAVGFNWNRLSTTPLVSNALPVDADFRAVSIEDSESRVRLIPSEDGACRVVCHESENGRVRYEVSVSDETLIVHRVDNRRWYERIGVDFDIGDIVWVVINPHKLIYKMKIIEVEDTHNKGKRTVSLVFGNKIPTQWEKVRALYR